MNCVILLLNESINMIKINYLLDMLEDAHCLRLLFSQVSVADMVV